MPDHISHVVLLLLENQSFDRMLGCFREIYPDLEGIAPPGQPANFNTDAAGVKYEQCPTRTKQVNPDPKHEVRFVLQQIQNNNAGFVLDFANNYPSTSQEQRQEIMGFYPMDFLPALHALAREFTICDHWFSSLPGPTWPNRFFALTGTCNGQALMPEGPKDPQLATYIDQTQDTIFDRLNARQRSWRVYYYDFPSSLLLRHQRKPENLLHYHKIDDFFAHSNKGDLPDFTFIEPKYFGADQNDDHPPHNIMKGEKLIADVYNAIRANPNLWQSTLLVITFDEHGGFYDHVSPPAAVPPDDKPARIDPENPTEIFRFDRLGVRVPAVLVSPWVAKRVEQTVFDHTSLLKYVIDKWNLDTLGARTTAANSIAVALRDEERNDTPTFIRVPYSDLVPPDPGLERADLSNHHKALEAFAYLVAKDSGNATAMQKAMQEPSRFIRAKAALGRALLSEGAKLTSDLEAFNRQQADDSVQLVESLIPPKRSA